MKNLRKLTNKELKSVNGGIQDCYYLIDGNQSLSMQSSHSIQL